MSPKEKHEQWCRTLAVCHSELHLSRRDVMEYPTLEFAGMMEQFRVIREEMNKQSTPKGIDGVNTGEISEEDLDTSSWFENEHSSSSNGGE